jgi:hypothetical protein
MVSQKDGARATGTGNTVEHYGAWIQPQRSREAAGKAPLEDQRGSEEEFLSPKAGPFARENGGAKADGAPFGLTAKREVDIMR